MADGESETPMMMDEAEGRSSDGEAISDDGELDDETMQAIASGTLPQSADTLVALNQVYQELLQTFMRRVEACLAENREKQRTLEAELRRYSGEGTKKQESRVPVLLYLPPYFRDSANIAPKKNMDAIAKLGELDPLVESPRKWTAAEKTKLISAVESAVLLIETSSFMNKRENVEEKLKSTSDPEELQALVTEKQTLDKQIESIRSRLDLTIVPSKTFDLIDWTQLSITAFNGTRTPIECHLMWKNELDPRLNQDPKWTPQELEDLKRLAVQYKYRNWKNIAEDLGTNRSAFQCFEKFQTECNGELTKKGWNQGDDEELKAAVQACRQGQFIPWDQVASMLEGRTNMQCKGRWTKVLAPGIKRGPWNDAEDLLLLSAVQKWGSNNWNRVSEMVPGRTGPQCRERWASVLTSGERLGPWTPEEDALLLAGVRQFGRGQWVKICNLIEGRRAPACKVRFRTLEKNGRSREDTISIQPSTSLVVRSAYDRARKVRERRDRIFKAYHNMVGKDPVLKLIAPDAERILSPLPAHIQQMFKDKLALVRKRIAESSTTQKRGRKRYVPVKRPRPAESEQDLFQVVLTDGSDDPERVHMGPTPVKSLADLIAGSSALLPPTTTTLKAVRNLLSWHGAGHLVGNHPLQDLMAGLIIDLETETDGRMDGVNSALTAKTTAVMRGYLEERDSEQPTASTSTFGQQNETAGGDVTDETVLERLVPNDPEAVKSFLEMREMTRRLFLWPAILTSIPTEKEA